MSKKTTWGDVAKRDLVELNGRPWLVEKIKPISKKKARVRVSGKGRSTSAEVKLAERVKILQHDAVQDETGAQRRWATKRELAEVMEPKPLEPGDASQTKPPAKAKGKGWDAKPEKGAEKRIVDLLSARLVGESTDESAGYYVPPVTIPTVAAHLALFHGGIPAAAETEAEMIAVHKAQHDEAASRGGVLFVNHWHTAKRP